jgi:hypothetical protein
MKFLTDRRGAVDTPFLVIAFITVTLVVLAFFVRHGAMVAEYPGRSIAEQMSYGQVSEVDLREVLDKAYARAAEEMGRNGTVSRAEIDSRFSSYAEEWIRRYFEARGIYNVSVQVSSRAGPVEAEQPYGSVTSIDFGDYTVEISV